MYYRRKILLSILEAFGGQLTRTQMQKLAFLFTRWQEKQAFDFVPYKFGCYSFQANQDLFTMAKKGLLKKSKQNGFNYWQKEDEKEYSKELKKKDQELLLRLERQFGGASQEDLIRYTYVHYPFYAINSTISERYLNAEQLNKVATQKPCYEEKKLFTIGYEGISLETYLNKLLLEDIRLLCDVRKNSFSMKYGFSKSQLQHACEQVGIEFIHIPELGIESNKRKGLKTPKDYEKLFNEYESTTLVDNRAHLNELVGLIEKYERIAITCFEAHHSMCHRGKITQAIEAEPEWDILIGHL